MSLTTLTEEGVETLPQTRDEKLNHLVTILDGIMDVRAFEMNVWFKEANPKYVECGFAGCALGWAATNPTFQKMGLRVRDFADGYDIIMIDPKVYEPASIIIPLYAGYQAGEKFFELNDVESAFLFHPDNYFDHKVPCTLYNPIVRQLTYKYGETDGRLEMALEPLFLGRHDRGILPFDVINHIRYIQEFPLTWEHLKL